MTASSTCKKFTAGIIGAVMMLCFGSARATAWGQPTTITGYYVYATGSAYIQVSTPENPDSCSSTHYIYLDTTQAFFKELYATIVSAQATGATVSIYYDGCVGSYPRASSIAVPNIW